MPKDGERGMMIQCHGSHACLVRTHISISTVTATAVWYRPWSIADRLPPGQHIMVSPLVVVVVVVCGCTVGAIGVARSVLKAMFSEIPDRSELDRPKPVWRRPNFEILTFSGFAWSV